MSAVNQVDVWRPSSNRQMKALDRYGKGNYKTLDKTMWVEVLLVWRRRNRRASKATGFDDKRLRQLRTKIQPKTDDEKDDLDPALSYAAVSRSSRSRRYVWALLA